MNAHQSWLKTGGRGRRRGRGQGKGKGGGRACMEKGAKMEAERD